MTVIELDLQTDHVVPERSGPRRPVAMAVAVLLALSTVSGAQQRPGPRVELLGDIRIGADAQFEVFGTDIIVTELNTITAYDVRTGKRRWRNESGLAEASVWQRGELLLASGVDVEAAPSQQPVETVAVDLATGVTRWRHSGHVDFFQPSSELIILQHMDFAQLDGDRRMSLYRPNGNLLWSLELGRLAQTADLAAGVVATIDPDSAELVLRDVITGEVVRRAMVPGAEGAEWLALEEGVMFIATANDVGLRFDLKTLARLPDLPEVEERRSDCGVVWCSTDPNRSGYLVLDKRSLATIYSNPRWISVAWTKAGLLGLGSPLIEDRPVPVISRYDLRTGVAVNMDGWEALDVSYAGLLQTAGRPTVLQFETSELTHFAVFDDRGLHLAGAVPVSDIRRCFSIDGFLACRVGTDLVRIWRLT